MADEQDIKEKPQNKLIFVNCVDGFVGQNLAKVSKSRMARPKSSAAEISAANIRENVVKLRKKNFYMSRS